jgi:ABC-2 type transport system ATP-binding protein
VTRDPLTSDQPAGISTASATAAAGTAAAAATEAPPTPALEVTGLVYAYKENRAVDGIDLLVPPGAVYGLLGPNGAGKTTAIRAVTTLLPIPAGMVRVFGRDPARDQMGVRRSLGYVPQQLSADSGLTGRENVANFARLFDVPRRVRGARVERALDAVGLLDVADRMASAYSGGMVRRLELAQALVSSPRLLILDEPTIGLDPIARDSVWRHIEDVRAKTGMTVLVTTHYMDEAEEYCDRISLMHKGRIRATGSPQELVASLPDGGAGASLEDAFRYYSGGAGLEESGQGGSFRDVRSTRSTASRVR